MNEMTQNKSRPYSLRKSRSILKWVYSWYKKKSDTLTAPQVEILEKDMSTLDEALLKQERESASETAHRLEKFATAHCKKTIFEYAWELILALVFALIIATIVRQMWFEFYEIPTGSMRPTFREQDHLTVTKTAFGINVPLETKHFYFDPELVQRSSVLIFSGDGLPLHDIYTTYFGIFPYTKRYIKRLIGKPGDTLYFYGGRIYGIDSQGNDLAELRDSPWMQPLEYVPMLSFEGNISQAGSQSILFKQMNLAAGKLTFNALGQITGEVFNGTAWVKDQPQAQASPHRTIETYSDLYGIRNYALARLLNKEQLKYFFSNTDDIGDGVLYLQLHHTPSLNYPKAALQNNSIAIPGYSTVIPLQQRHLDAIMDNIYTARFVVADGKARRYSIGDNRTYPTAPRFPTVPDGTYEFYYGDVSKIHWGGIASDVLPDNPLYSREPDNVQRLFNMGIEMDTSYAPNANNPNFFPHRYAYFRDGDLYLVGTPVIQKNDQTLIDFLRKEEQKQSRSTSAFPYIAFRDYGPPFKEEKIDEDFIRAFGVKVPEKSYLVLGDNHAMSGDSRVFGFVPEDNLQGAPCWIIWPPCDRLGAPPQKPYPFMNLPRAIIWTIAGLIALGWYIYYRRSISRPIFIKKA